MEFEDKIFSRKKINFNKLDKYGFKKENEVYKFSKQFMDTFRAEIFINKTGKVSGKVYDTEIEDEYINFRIESQIGDFVGRVRNNYKNILEDIADNCCENTYFKTDQANRIADLINHKYKDLPEFLWNKSPSDAVFRNPNNKKWYGLIMNINKSKIDEGDYEIEIINVKVDSKKIPELLIKKGYYKAYHMNKENWITIILDDTLSDEEIEKCIEKSHQYTEQSNEWIVPANPEYYDVVKAFNEESVILWKQSSNINIGDIVYLYVAKPYSAILYKCEALEVNIPYKSKNKYLTISKVMKIKLLEKYDKNEYTFEKLKEYGVRAVRGPRSMPDKLSKKINKK